MRRRSRRSLDGQPGRRCAGDPRGRLSMVRRRAESRFAGPGGALGRLSMVRAVARRCGA